MMTEHEEDAVKKILENPKSTASARADAVRKQLADMREELTRYPEDEVTRSVAGRLVQMNLQVLDILREVL